MVCQRCRGLLVYETFDDWGIESESPYTATRCINCGYIEDAVVRANRFRRSERTRVIPHRRRMVRKREVVFSMSDSQEYASIRRAGAATASAHLTSNHDGRVLQRAPARPSF
jgi:hypothetical protein